jgi:hypothetical protein
MNGALLLLHRITLVSTLSNVFGCRGGYPSIYIGQEAVLNAILAQSMHSTTFACRGGTATARRGKEVPRGERPPPRSGRPLAATYGHRLCMAGLGLDMDQCFVVLCPFWVGLVGVSLVLLRESASEKRLSVKSSMYLCLWPEITHF